MTPRSKWYPRHRHNDRTKIVSCDSRLDPKSLDVGRIPYSRLDRRVPPTVHHIESTTSTSGWIENDLDDDDDDESVWSVSTILFEWDREKEAGRYACANPLLECEWPSCTYRSGHWGSCATLIVLLLRRWWETSRVLPVVIPTLVVARRRNRVVVIPPRDRSHHRLLLRSVSVLHSSLWWYPSLWWYQTTVGQCNLVYTRTVVAAIL